MSTSRTSGRITDADFVASVLSDGEWHSQHSILARSQRERGHGLTLHSRASDLRKRGWTIEQKSRRTSSGRVESFYRMVSRPAVADEPKRRLPYLCAECGRRFFNVGWHAEACGSSDYRLLEGVAARGDVDATPSSGPTGPSPGSPQVRNDAAVVPSVGPFQLAIDVPVTEREREAAA